MNQMKSSKRSLTVWHHMFRISMRRKRCLTTSLQLLQLHQLLQQSLRLPWPLPNPKPTSELEALRLSPLCFNQLKVLLGMQKQRRMMQWRMMIQHNMSLTMSQMRTITHPLLHHQHQVCLHFRFPVLQEQGLHQLPLHLRRRRLHLPMFQ